MQRENSIEKGEVSGEVTELLEHMWQEATGELSDVLAVPAEQITLDQVGAI